MISFAASQHDDNVPLIHAGQGFALIVEPLQTPLLQTGEHQFNRNLPADCLFNPEIDFAHSAFAEFIDQSVVADPLERQPLCLPYKCCLTHDSSLDVHLQKSCLMFSNKWFCQEVGDIETSAFQI